MLISLFFLSDHFGLLGAVLANFVMAALLAFNVYMYKLSGFTRYIQVLLLDMSWGVLVPGLSLVLVSISPSIITKFAVTTLIGGLLVSVLLKDDWGRL